MPCRVSVQAHRCLLHPADHSRKGRIPFSKCLEVFIARFAKPALVTVVLRVIQGRRKNGDARNELVDVCHNYGGESTCAHDSVGWRLPRVSSWVHHGGEPRISWEGTRDVAEVLWALR
jgi:hypothetical protein